MLDSTVIWYCTLLLCYFRWYELKYFSKRFHIDISIDKVLYRKNFIEDAVEQQMACPYEGNASEEFTEREQALPTEWTGTDHTDLNGLKELKNFTWTKRNRLWVKDQRISSKRCWNGQNTVSQRRVRTLQVRRTEWHRVAILVAPFKAWFFSRNYPSGMKSNNIIWQINAVLFDKLLLVIYQIIYQLPFTNYHLPITIYQLPFTNYHW